MDSLEDDPIKCQICLESYGEFSKIFLIQFIFLDNSVHEPIVSICGHTWVFFQSMGLVDWWSWTFRICRHCAITLNNSNELNSTRCPVCRNAYAFANMIVNFDLISKLIFIIFCPEIFNSELFNVIQKQVDEIQNLKSQLDEQKKLLEISTKELKSNHPKRNDYEYFQ